MGSGLVPKYQELAGLTGPFEYVNGIATRSALVVVTHEPTRNIRERKCWTLLLTLR